MRRFNTSGPNIIRQHYTAGSSQVSLSIPNAVNSGIYLARITVGNQQVVKKVMKL